ncbi:NAD+ synthase [Rubinisphaera margarita]|uniref:NAD+ synthase n=1 Tax=Rubinisphaera margarita TaxID=2909586 RepID=UPI001EE9045E|nr:NAD+ synthase [Rubinisphaera margarita]MCG6157542.1 NAD+ synthase [Rubinisphaera margarita]
MRIAIAQLNPTVGDLQGNCAKILEAARQAAEQQAELMVCAELVVCGYPPKDLLLRSGFVAACDEAVEYLAKQLPRDLAVLVGHPTHRDQPGGRCANAASLLHECEIQKTIAKTLLPNYDVFDERRYFRPAEDVEHVEFKGRKLGVHICEDAWYGQPETFYHERQLCEFDPVQRLMDRGAELLINLSASPFEVGKQGRRHQLMQDHCRRGGVPAVFVNQIGGNDDLVFDGGSFVLNASAEVVHQSKSFVELVETVDLESLTESLGDTTLPRTEQLFHALVLGLQDYARKSGFKECVLGLSGGIDSAVASLLAAEAFGPQHVHTLMMPSRYSSGHSVDDSEALARNLGIEAIKVPIDEVHKAYERTVCVQDDLAKDPGGLPDQNLQARIRGAMVMIRSNARGWLPLATGNKSELAVGYCTLYGDMAGGFAVLSDVLKRDVYALARFANERAGRELIPDHIITKAPSAELAPNQFDQDSLPPYDILDGILELLVEKELSLHDVSRHYPEDVVKWVLRKLDQNEFKRRQMPPGIKLTRRAFGSGRRMPMAARYTSPPGADSGDAR